MMKIVVLVYISRYAGELIDQMEKEGIAICRIIVQYTKKESIKHVIRKYCERYGAKETALKVLKSTRRRILGKTLKRGEARESWWDRCSNVSYVYDLNAPDCENVVKGEVPDLIVLGDVKIIGDNILQIPKNHYLDPDVSGRPVLSLWVW